VDENLRVILVAENSPAAKAGLQVGDQIVSVDSISPPKDGQVAHTFSDALRKAMKDGAPVTVVYRRGTTDNTVTVTPTQICDYGLNLVEDDSLNAFADGDSINILTGMMRFTETDNELGLVIGHELSHNAMRHIDAKRINAMGGLLLDILAAAAGINTQGAFAHAASMAYSKEFEAEADYIGLYAVALTGQNLSSAPDFWRKVAAAHPDSIKQDYASTHPATPERFLHLEQVVAEINDKRARNVAVLPDLTKIPSSQKQEEPSQVLGFSPK
jgi:Zn-dependent protease with chaperone function